MYAPNLMHWCLCFLKSADFKIEKREYRESNDKEELLQKFNGQDVAKQN